MIDITPHQAKAIDDGLTGGRRQTISWYECLADSDAICQCGNPAWKFGGVGLCFSCTTGESDSSDDYEIVPENAIATERRMGK